MDAKERRVPPWGPRVRTALQARGKTIGWLADWVGIHRSQLSRRISGDPHYADLSEERKHLIAKSLEYPYEWLFGECGESEEKN